MGEKTERMKGLAMNEQQMNSVKDGVEIDLQKLLLAYLRNWWIIVLCGLVAALGTLYVTANHITPMYRAGVTVYVNNIRSDQVVEYLSSSNLTASKQLVNTYVNIIGSDSVLEKVVQEADLPYSASHVRSMMTTAQVGDTEIFKVYITHADPKVAAQVANAIADVAPGEIEEIVVGSSTKIIDYAKVPKTQHTPSNRKNTLLGGVIGVVVAVLYVTLRYLLDVRIKDTEDLENLYAIPILCQIPHINTADTRKNGYGYDTGSTRTRGGETG